jgi:hypothetical protein
MANSKAKFYYRSIIDQDADGFVISGDFAPTANINDRRGDTYAYTDDTGSGDGTSEEIVADFGTERTVDTIFLKSNFKTFKVYLWDTNETGTGGEGYVEIASYTANAADFLVISIDSVLTSKVKIACTHTITANEVKKIYTLEITEYIGELALEGFNILSKTERTKWETLYGGSVQVVQYPNFPKVQIDLSWDNMAAADYAIYSELKDLFQIDSLLVYLYFSDDFDLMAASALYLVNDLEDKEATPYAEVFTSGVKAVMKLAEC